MNDNSIDYVYTDKNRYDNQINCISLSIGSINKSMFLYKVKSNYSDYIIMIQAVGFSAISIMSHVQAPGFQVWFGKATISYPLYLIPVKLVSFLPTLLCVFLLKFFFTFIFI